MKLFRIIIAVFLVLLLSFNRLQAQETLSSDTLQLQEVEILGKTARFFPVSVMPAIEFQMEPLRDVGDFLRTAPNVSGIRKGGVGIDPVVRGFKYNQVTVLLNQGIKIEGGCPNRMDPVASHVESENIQQISVVKGPYVLKYGPVLGALINLETELPAPHEKPGIHAEALFGFESNWNGQREHIALSGGNQTIFFNASAGYKGYGSYTGGNGILYNTSFKKLYGNAALGFVPSPNHKIVANYAYDQGKDILYPALPMDETLDQTHVGSVHYQGKNISKSIKSIEFLGYFSPVHHEMDNLLRPTAKTMQAITIVDAWNGGGKLAGNFSTGKHNILAGIDFEHVFKDGDKKMTMTMVMSGDTFTSVKHTNVWLNAVTNNAGAFFEYKIPVTRFEMTAALRMDYNQANSEDTFRLVANDIEYFSNLSSNFFNLSFSIGMKKQLTEWLGVSAAVGRGTRSPSVLERFIKLMPVQYDAYDYLGNPQLKPEKNHQVDFAFDLSHPDYGIVTVGGFFSAITDYIIGRIVPPSVIKPSTQGAPGVKQFINTDYVFLTGFEFVYQSPSSKPWSILATAAATWGTEPEAIKYIVTGGQVTDQVVVKNDPLPEIPPLEGSIKASWSFFKRTLTPAVNIRMVNAQRRVSESYGEPATPGFVTAGFSVNYSPIRYISVAAGIENIFDNPYYEHLNRRIVGSTERLYEPGRVFFVNVVARGEIVK